MKKPPQGPHLYTDIGLKIRALLYTDYPPTPKFSITASRLHGQESLTFVGTKKDDSLYAVVRTGSENYNTVTYARVDTNPTSITTTTYNEINVAPGLKAVLGFTYQNSYKVGLKYKHNYGGITTAVRFMENPCVDFSGVIGTNFLSLGTDVTFNTTTKSFSKYNFGCSTSINNFIFSMNLNDKCDLLKASYYEILSPSTKTAVGVEVSHIFSTHLCSSVLGAQLELNPLTTVKTRLGLSKFSALIQREILPMTRVTVYGEFDIKNIRKWPKFGMALDLKFDMN
ncbi:Voltage-dependent anion-selective channel protein 1 [Ranunculus cassubicifolius]